MEKLLLTVTVVNLDRFTAKNNLITYTKVFAKLYNWINSSHIHKFQEMVELES